MEKDKAKVKGASGRVVRPVKKNLVIFLKVSFMSAVLKGSVFSLLLC